MGRKKKYNTLEEKQQAQRENQMRHYWRNADRLKKEGLEKYYTKKKEKRIL